VDFMVEGFEEAEPFMAGAGAAAELKAEPSGMRGSGSNRNLHTDYDSNLLLARRALTQFP
jgi:hypothetical protein